MVQVVRYDIEEIADVAVQRLGVVLVVVEDALDGAGRVVWSQRLVADVLKTCLLYTSPSPRDRSRSRMPSSA